MYGIWAAVDRESICLSECIQLYFLWGKVSLKQLTWMAPAQRLPQRETALTLDGLKGFEIFYTEQRLGQLPDEELQQAGGIMLFDTFPIKSPFIKLCFQFLAKILKGRRKKKKKRQERKATSKCIFFFPCWECDTLPTFQEILLCRKESKSTKGQHFSVTQKNTTQPSTLFPWQKIAKATEFKNCIHFPASATDLKRSRFNQEKIS